MGRQVELILIRRGGLVASLCLILTMVAWGAAALGGHPSDAVHPFVHCVVHHADGHLTAVFGYQNTARDRITLPIGVRNQFEPGVRNRRQPTEFDSGLHSDAVRVPFRGRILSWKLGRSRAFVTRFSKVCSTPKLQNHPPQVSAGDDKALAFPSTITLDGHIRDDGLPLGSTPTIQWTQLSGPAPVTLSAPNASSTKAHFAAPGVYELQLSGADSDLSASDHVRLTVASPKPGALFAIVINDGAECIVNLGTQEIFAGQPVTISTDACPNTFPEGSTNDPTIALIGIVDASRATPNISFSSNMPPPAELSAAGVRAVFGLLTNSNHTGFIDTLLAAIPAFGDTLELAAQDNASYEARLGGTRGLPPPIPLGPEKSRAISLIGAATQPLQQALMLQVGIDFSEGESVIFNAAVPSLDCDVPVDIDPALVQSAVGKCTGALDEVFVANPPRSDQEIEVALAAFTVCVNAAVCSAAPTPDLPVNSGRKEIRVAQDRMEGDFACFDGASLDRALAECLQDQARFAIGCGATYVAALARAARSPVGVAIATAAYAACVDLGAFFYEVCIRTAAIRHSNICRSCDICQENGTCVIDAQRCGDCGPICDESQCEVCFPDATGSVGCRSACTGANEECDGAGRCVAACEAGKTQCQRPGQQPVCTDLGVDANNCGTCGNQCVSGRTCISGKCAQDCSPGQWCPGGDPSESQDGCCTDPTAICAVLPPNGAAACCPAGTPFEVCFPDTP